MWYNRRTILKGRLLMRLVIKNKNDKIEIIDVIDRETKVGLSEQAK